MQILSTKSGDKTEESPRVVVRVKTTAYETANGYAFKKELIKLKRLCKGFDFFQEDCRMIDIYDVYEKIKNLYQVNDGIYQIIMTNVSKDWETGYVDDWDYELIPYDK